MRTVTLNEFLTLPRGTVYSQWGALLIKQGDCGPRDFFFRRLCPTQGDDGPFMIGSVERWGELDESAVFYVFDADDVRRMVELLNSSVPRMKI
jgi:hypothetical protein